MKTYELVPPKPCLNLYMAGSERRVFCVMFSAGHWAFGPEFWGKSFGLYLGPLAFVFGDIRDHE